MKTKSTALNYLCLILGAILFCVPGCKKQDIVVKKVPVITWANPADIVEGILSTTQLNAKADIDGKFLYTPAEKTVMKVGDNQVLTVTFTPTDLVNYQSVTQSVKINVTAAIIQKKPVITWANPADIIVGTLLSETQLNATAVVPGVSVYTPAKGAKLNAGANQVLKVVFTPNDAATYDTASKSVVINVLTIGDAYQGGKVAYIFASGDPGYVAGETHGLIAAPSDQNNGLAIQWYNGTDITTGTTYSELGTGARNTNTIVAIQGVGSYAAKLCADLDLGGYTDWYLPSIDELAKVYLNRIAVGGFASDKYWSSTASGASWAYYWYFPSGGMHDTNKFATFYVRAIRSF